MGCCGSLCLDPPLVTDTDHDTEIEVATKNVIDNEELQIIDRIKENVTEEILLKLDISKSSEEDSESFSPEKLEKEIIQGFQVLSPEAALVLANKILNKERR